MIKLLLVRNVVQPLIVVMTALSCGELLLVQTSLAAESAQGGDVPAQEKVPGTEQAQPRDVTFTIKAFVIEGTDLFSRDELQQQVRPFVGRGKTSTDVEKARDALERFFHEHGYPTLVVNIPEQKVESRKIRLEVIENPVGTVKISGNRWFSEEKIRREIPALASGLVINLDEVRNEINHINQNPDFKVVPDMVPGKIPETVDINLKVSDSPPLHGSLELNNRATHNTTDLRLTAGLSYDNLWQREHSISAQYQVAPENPDDAQMATGSYSLAAPWDRDERLTLYGVWSNNNTTIGGGFGNISKGTIVGLRLMVPLTPYGDFNHSLMAGFDYKDFGQTVSASGSQINTPVTYMPATVTYLAFLRDSQGLTSFNAGVNFAFRGMVASEQDFANKRYESRSDYIYVTAGIERTQQLPKDFSLRVKADGQMASGPLISNEEYLAGGIDSVRGYWESEASGDDAAHAVVELSAPDLLKKDGRPGTASLNPYVFFDTAALWVRDAQAGQQSFFDLQGTGFGLRGTLFKGFDYETDVAVALRSTSAVAAGDVYCHFRVRYQF